MAAGLTFSEDRLLRALLLAGAGFGGMVLSLLMLLILFAKAGGLGAFLLTSFAAASLVPLYAGVILLVDRYEKEPGWLLLGAFFWGAVVATFFSLIVNTGAGLVLAGLFGPELGERLSAPLVAPLSEETSKGLVVLLIALLWKHEFNSTVDGIVYGALAGLGFAMTENVLYFARALQKGGLVGLGLLFYVRVLLGGFGHSVYTACTGAGIGYWREVGGARGALAALGGYGAGMFLHFLWNFLASFGPKAGNPFVVLFLQLPLQAALLEFGPLLVLVGVAVFAWRREARVVRETLATVQDPELVRPEELPVLESARERFRRLLAALRSGGFQAYWQTRQLYDTLLEYAFVLWHEKKEQRPDQARRERLEQRVRALRARLAGGPEKGGRA